jgi:thiosulfate/3-mercaptopyruvate sulfurtransferase
MKFPAACLGIPHGVALSFRFMESQTLIGVDSLRELLGKPRVAVIDCRFDLMDPGAGRRAYLAAHIPGARYADLNQDLSAPVGPHTGRHPLPAPETFARRLGELGIGNGTQVVAYDDASGSFAARLWWMLRWVGHGAVAVLDGGFKAWTARGGALQSATPDFRIERFVPRIGAQSVLSTAEIERALQSSPILLVDARAQERFAGKVEPIDPVAGHIPGAVNHPMTTNLDADGRFLPAAELKARWRERLGGTGAENVVAMCGSGVTACHNLLSLEVAGLSGGKLYAGSWSEWIRDPRRPVARGS